MAILSCLKQKQGVLGSALHCRPGKDLELATHDGLVGAVFVATSMATLGGFGAVGGCILDHRQDTSS